MLNLIIHSTLTKACLPIASAAPSMKEGLQKAEGHLFTSFIVSGIHSLFSFLLMIMKGEWISGTIFHKTGREQLHSIRQGSSEGLSRYFAKHLLFIPDPQPDRLPFDTPDRGYWPPS
ncbi:MAG TPA: hypothetical protein PLK63_13175 [Catalimonadaceae bacterium]|nr:hypothetical protein [Catalimonadaceae bacterium]